MSDPAPSPLAAVTVASPAGPDWKAVAWSAAAIAAVVGLFWAALHFAGTRRVNPVSTRVQSLLFSRRKGWTLEKANRWASSHGYRHKDADVTAHNIRLRQSDPGRYRLLRTVTFSKDRGIKAVVGR
jgi:hypothetical protein